MSTNETRIENIGDANVTFEKINNQWMVSSLEIHRIFKAGMTTKHGEMIRDMKSKSEYYWNTFIDGEEILASSWTNSNNKTNNMYYFNRPAMSFYITSMTGRKADKFKLAFIRKFEELEKMVARIARGEVNLSIEASELINNMVDDEDETISMGDFSQHINDTRTVTGTNCIFTWKED